MPSELVSKIQAGRKMLCLHLHWVCGWSLGLSSFPSPGGTNEGSWSHWKLWVQSRACMSSNRSSTTYLAKWIPENLLRPIPQTCFGEEGKRLHHNETSCFLSWKSTLFPKHRAKHSLHWLLKKISLSWFTNWCAHLLVRKSIFQAVTHLWISSTGSYSPWLRDGLQNTVMLLPFQGMMFFPAP